ncbi:hypothetical protein IW967_05570 [Alicyclobacillus mali]|uniref:Uncharacterized protein n=1 Tax=Alicyclobacillus mali (ex Roth et al. 2021) TaxID=1123961 RepID=A0ABS0F219_9BACL|nr:hypothetical protein [Alicyclobacillus mali (ex Roth et al. 2021)]MBF8377340.1 hypothetical protein [Alicyclobacillus mali (ex Roth et al. 2021)]
MSTSERGTPWGAMAAFFAGQILITLGLYVVCNVLSILLIPLTGSYSYAISGPVTFALYAAIWGGIWHASYQNSGKQDFARKLAAATLPLVMLTALYVARHPTPNFQLMIPILPQDIHFDLASLVTMTLLFPWYAVVWRQSLASPRQAARFTVLFIPCLIAGVLIFAASYTMLPANW